MTATPRRFFFSVALAISLVGLLPFARPVSLAASPMLQSAIGGDVILIVSDDQPAHTLEHMPLTNALIGGQGVRFTRAFASSPLCCPSRASILTGQYVHNHGVRSNNAPTGGATVFRDNSTLATWLQAAGYETALVGKYLNEYGKLQPRPYIPPGWSQWWALVAGAGYYNYVLLENGIRKKYGSLPEDYGPKIMAEHAVRFIENTPPGKRLFLYFAPFSPHAPATPAPEDSDTFRDVPLTRSPAFNEADVSDKPQWLRELPLITPDGIAAADAFQRRQLETLQAVDRAVAGIVAALQRAGRLSGATIIYTSDHGLSWGEHRWLNRKNCIYEECIRVPLLIRAPGVTPRIDNRLVSLVDLAPTIAEIAGTLADDRVDGQTLLQALYDQATPRRRSVLIENLGGRESPHSRAVRTKRFKFAATEGGEVELYDLNLDPFEMENVANDPAYASVRGDLAGQLAALESD